jgi:hypothetical protein
MSALRPPGMPLGEPQRQRTIAGGLEEFFSNDAMGTKRIRTRFDSGVTSLDGQLGELSTQTAHQPAHRSDDGFQPSKVCADSRSAATKSPWCQECFGPPRLSRSFALPMLFVSHSVHSTCSIGRSGQAQAGGPRNALQHLLLLRVFAPSCESILLPKQVVKVASRAGIAPNRVSRSLRVYESRGHGSGRSWDTRPPCPGALVRSPVQECRVPAD